MISLARTRADRSLPVELPQRPLSARTLLSSIGPLRKRQLGLPFGIRREPIQAGGAGPFSIAPDAGDAWEIFSPGNRVFEGSVLEMKT